MPACHVESTKYLLLLAKHWGLEKKDKVFSLHEIYILVGETEIKNNTK